MKRISFRNLPWILKGVIWGIIMFLGVSLIFRFIEGDAITVQNLIKYFIVWQFFGFIYAILMKFIFKGVNKEQQNINQPETDK